jgi:Calx-beta domain/Domain of unknown function (DUF4114)/RTX calcium-binding nonapeptide repeat (4 copies)
MDFSKISAKITFPLTDPNKKFTSPQEKEIRKVIEQTYTYSGTAQKMLDHWVNDLGKTIIINFDEGKFRAGSSGIYSGNLYIDPTYLYGKTYINNKGQAVPYTLLQAIIHELGHALNGTNNPTGTRDIDLKDNSSEHDYSLLTDYKGANVPFINTIWAEITSNSKGQFNLTPAISYLATANNALQKIGYNYTSGVAITNAVNIESVDEENKYPPQAKWNSSILGQSDDLLIGGPSDNTITSGSGNDFLFGGAGDDVLDGGNGIDTAVYFGLKSNYSILPNIITNTNPLFLGSSKFWDGTYTVSQKNVGETNSGTDRLKDIEFLQFDDQKYDLKNLLKSDLAIVLDTSGSMGANIRNLAPELYALKNAVFADGRDGRFGILGFGDNTIGEQAKVILPFTAQESTANAVMDSMIDKVGYGYGSNETYFSSTDGDVFGGGGDEAETPFNGLQLALNGAMGQWRTEAGARRIFLFTDAPAKDYALASQVTTLAHNIGATVETTSSVALSGGMINTFNLTFGSNSSVARLVGTDDLIANPDLSSFAASNNPINPEPTTTQVQIFTIFTGSLGSDTAALEAISRDNSGVFLAGLSSDELMRKLVEIVNTLPVEQSPIKPIISIASVTQLEGNSDTNNYAFNLILSNPSTEIVTVKYTTADGTATAVSDYTAATGTVTFNPGETSRTINISVKGDTTLEKDETFTVNLTDPVGGTISQAIATATIVDDDRPVIALTTPDANASEDKKDPGLFNLTRIGSIAQALTVNYTIAGTATNDTDYKKLTGIATFKAGQSQTSIEIKPSNDKIYEGSETVILTLNDGGINYKFDPIANTGTVTIADEDLPSISLSVTDDKAAETKIGEVANPGQFTLKRTGITTDALTVSYTIDGSASNGIDYQKLENSVTFAAGSDTAIINIRPIDDQFAEGTETVKLKLVDNSSYTINGEKSGTVKIADNDHPRDRDAKDLVLKVENLDESKPRIGTGLQSGSEGEVIDLRGFGGQTLKVDTIATSDAGYQNYIGFYAVEDAQGTLANGLKVSDPGYAEAAIKSAILRSSKQQTQLDLSVAGGKIFAPVVIANGTFEDYLNRNPQNQASSNIHAYFNYIGANTDKVDHFKLLGDNKFGIEDSYGGGDKDYNDLVLQMNIKI